MNQLLKAAALSESPSAFSRAGSRGGIAFWSGAVARGAAVFFLLRFFAAGFSYGVDRDEGPIARKRVYPTGCALSEIWWPMAAGEADGICR